MEPIEALVLAGGKGTRLYPLTHITEKALLDVRGKPVLSHILDGIDSSRYVSKMFVMHPNRHEQQFKLFEEFFRYETPLKMINDRDRDPEKDPAGSIGGISYVIKKEKVENDLLVMAGDNLFDFRVDDFINFFIKNGRKTSIAVYDFEDKGMVANKFGVVELYKDNIRIKNFEEKPHEPKTALAATFCYLLSKEDFPLLREDMSRENAGELIKYMVDGGKVVNAFQFRGKWFDIGTHEGLAKARNEF